MRFIVSDFFSKHESITCFYTKFWGVYVTFSVASCSVFASIWLNDELTVRSPLHKKQPPQMCLKSRLYFTLTLLQTSFFFFFLIYNTDTAHIFYRNFSCVSGHYSLLVEGLTDLKHKAEEEDEKQYKVEFFLRQLAVYHQSKHC